MLNFLEHADCHGVSCSGSCTSSIGVFHFNNDFSFVGPAEGKSISFVTLCVWVHEMERNLRATGADRLWAIDPWGRAVLSKETLTRRGDDILPALHFSFRLSQGGWSHEQGRLYVSTNMNMRQFVLWMVVRLVTSTALCGHIHRV